jgi:hypothetical protein
MKTKNIIVILFGFILFSSIIAGASATCMIQGWINYQNGNPFDVPSKVTGCCENLANISQSCIEEYIVPGELWNFSWGNITDSCYSVCGRVYISAKTSFVGNQEPSYWYGTTPFFPMDDKNTEMWRTRTMHWSTITMNRMPFYFELPF